MPRETINPKNLLKKCKARKLTVTALARKIGRSREAVYFAAEKPSRFPKTYALMSEVLNHG